MDQDNGQQMGQNPQVNTSPEFKNDIQNPTGSFAKVEKNRAGRKSYDFLLTLTAIMFISGGYAIWFFLNLPSEIEAETMYVPIRHNNTMGMMASSTVEGSRLQD